jgi:hypothetical protein
MSRILAWKVVLVLGLAMSSPLSAAAIGSVTAGDVTFGYTGSFSTTPGNPGNVQFKTSNTAADVAFQSWWFYRVSGATQESAFANPDLELYSGSVGRLGWYDPTGAGLFGSVLSFEVLDPGTGGNLFQNMRIFNTSGASLTIDVFQYLDFDINGTPGSDRVSLGSNPDGILINQREGGQTLPMVGYGANAYQVSTYSQLRTNLTNNGVNNLTNGGITNAAGDWTVGFQWSVTIAAGSYQDFMTQIASNAPLENPTVTVIPEPGTALLMGLGLLLLAAPERRAQAA